MMKAFEGHWSVHPYDGQRTLDAIVAGPASDSLADAARRLAPPAEGNHVSLQSLRGQS